MIKNPLTTEQMADFEAEIIANFRKTYTAALAVATDDDLSGTTHLLAKCALVLTAEAFDVSTNRPAWKKFLAKLRRSI